MSLEEDSFKTSISWESPIVSLLVSPEELLEPLLGPGTIPVVSPPRLGPGGALESVFGVKAGLELAIELFL